MKLTVSLDEQPHSVNQDPCTPCLGVISEIRSVRYPVRIKFLQNVLKHIVVEL